MSAADLNELRYTFVVVVIAATLVTPEESVSEVMNACFEVKGKE